MNSSRSRSWVILGLMFVAVVTAILISGTATRGQTGAYDADLDDVPKQALLTEEGRALFEQLQFLRRSEASMGKRHPKLKSVQAQIAEIKKKLAAWGDGDEAEDDNPFARPQQMSNKELRELVFRLTARVQHLEQRVESLEKRLEVY